MTDRIGQRTLAAIVGALIAVVFLGGVLALFADDDPLPAAGARLRLTSADSLVVAEGGTGALSDGAVLRAGDEVEVAEGMAVLELAGGGTIEIRAGHGGNDDSRLEVGEPSHLLAGDALAVGDGLAVEAAGTLVTLRGGDAATRIRRELAVTTATYRGSAAVDSAGQERVVPAYRQLAVASVGRTDPAPVPFEVDGSDPWDQRYLGSAIALTRSLDSLSRTFTAQGGPRATVADYEALLPRLADESDFGGALLDAERPDGETLVGAAIATLGTAGTFTDRWNSIFVFRDAGAVWGLVALDQGVVDGPVLGEVESALSRSVDVTGPDVAVGPLITPPATTPTTTAPPTSPGTTTPTTAPSPPTTTPPTTPEPAPVLPELPDVPLEPDDPLPDAGGLLEGLLGPVSDLLSGLLGG